MPKTIGFENQENPRERQKLRIKESPLLITDHALDRIKERWKPADRLDEKPANDFEWQKLIEDLLRNSTEIQLKPVPKVKRLISNKFEEARYFYDSLYHLTFVVTEDGERFIVKSVEIPDYIKRGKQIDEDEENSD